LFSAASAYRHAQAAQLEAQRALDRATAAVQEARQPLVDQIVEAAREGVPQREIHRRIGDLWSREHIRKLCRAAGIDLSRK
jgi:hypothetical protein